MSVRRAEARWSTGRGAAHVDDSGSSTFPASVHPFVATRERLAARSPAAAQPPAADLDPFTGMIVGVVVSVAFWSLVGALLFFSS